MKLKLRRQNIKIPAVMRYLPFRRKSPPGREGLWNQLWRMAKHPNTKCHSIVTSKCFSFNVQYIPTMSVEVQPWPDGRYNLGRGRRPGQTLSSHVTLSSHFKWGSPSSSTLQQHHTSWHAICTMTYPDNFAHENIAQEMRVNCDHFSESIRQNWSTNLFLIKLVSYILHSHTKTYLRFLRHFACLLSTSLSSLLSSSSK